MNRFSNVLRSQDFDALNCEEPDDNDTVAESALFKSDRNAGKPWLAMLKSCCAMSSPYAATSPKPWAT